MMTTTAGSEGSRIAAWRLTSPDELREAAGWSPHPTSALLKKFLPNDVAGMARCSGNAHGAAAGERAASETFATRLSGMSISGTAFAPIVRTLQRWLTFSWSPVNPMGSIKVRERHIAHELSHLITLSRSTT
jgi:hypothetical protein